MCKKELLPALKAQAREWGASGTAIVPVDEIVFRPEFRQACEQNSCGKYNRCWMCPPDVGDIQALISAAQTYNQAFVFQTVSPLQNSFDIEGMLAAGHKHNGIMRLLAGKAKEMFGATLNLAGGACQVCEVCGKQDNIPCRNPQEATSSLEAYGVDVTCLASICGLPYNNGVNTVTYFGAILIP